MNKQIKSNKKERRRRENKKRHMVEGRGRSSADEWDPGSSSVDGERRSNKGFVVFRWHKRKGQLGTCPYRSNTTKEN